jgi:hypothetical protein
MALYVPWLADASRLTGYPVVEVPGWKTLGHGGLRVCETTTGHHTANPQRGDYPSLNIVRNGRGDLAGPLAQLGLARSGTIYIIAAGLAYQAGASRWAGFTDLNDEGIGIEAESAGTVDDWTPEQRDCYPRLIAALLYYMRRGADRFGFHKEVCRPAGRKIDAAYWDGNTTRQRVAWLLGDPLNRIPRFASPARDARDAFVPPPSSSEDPVAVIEIRPGADGTFRHTVMAEAGSSSQTVAKAWITYGSAWGVTRFTITPLKADGTAMGQNTQDVANNKSGWFELPDGVHMVTIEGKSSGSVPAAALVTKAK